MRVAVIQFPGSNADWDALHVAKDVMGWDARGVFHKEGELGPVDALIIPGGFSYGDYLRPGAIARFSPVTEAILEFAKRGGPILGICNGFQILTELHLLPGALTRNAHLRFECRDVFMRREASGVFTEGLERGAILRLPIAHADGRYQCDEKTLLRLEGDGQIAFRYCGSEGQPAWVESDASGGPNPSGLATNPNGSMADIAGIYDPAGRILGLMPHPERASEAVLGGRDGRHDGLGLFRSLGAHLSSNDSSGDARGESQQ